MMSSTDTTISEGWSFTQLKSEKFKDVKPDWEECKVPTQTHVELKRLGKIPDPFKALNEWAVQCKSTIYLIKLTKRGRRSGLGFQNDFPSFQRTAGR